MSFTADVTILGACQLRRQQAISQSGHMIGMFIPRCTSSGHYEELQCHSGTGECWCVDRVDGLEMIGSRQRVPSMPDCTRFSGKTHLMFWCELTQIQRFLQITSIYSSRAQADIRSRENCLIKAKILKMMIVPEFVCGYNLCLVDKDVSRGAICCCIDVE